VFLAQTHKSIEIFIINDGFLGLLSLISDMVNWVKSSGYVFFKGRVLNDTA